MFKVIKIQSPTNKSISVINEDHTHKKYEDLEKMGLDSVLLSDENFEKTLAGLNNISILDTDKRSSLTHKSKFYLDVPNELSDLFKQLNIEYNTPPYNHFLLLKYLQNDFFLNHVDTNLTTDPLEERTHTHAYTCLIFCPYEKFEGGELVFNHPEKLYEIKFDPSIEINKGNFVAVIFSIDMHHEVLPIKSGSRYVFKKPLFVKSVSGTTNIINVDDIVDDLCDGGHHYFSAKGGGDY